MGVSYYLACATHQELVDLDRIDDIHFRLYERKKGKRIPKTIVSELRRVFEKEGAAGPNQAVLRNRLLEILAAFVERHPRCSRFALQDGDSLTACVPSGFAGSDSTTGRPPNSEAEFLVLRDHIIARYWGAAQSEDTAAFFSGITAAVEARAKVNPERPMPSWSPFVGRVAAETSREAEKARPRKTEGAYDVVSDLQKRPMRKP